MAKRKEHFSNKSLTKISQNKLFAVLLVGLFLIVGLFIIYKSFAGGAPVFRDNAEYWRPRIAQ